MRYTICENCRDWAEKCTRCTRCGKMVCDKCLDAFSGLCIPCTAFVSLLPKAYFSEIELARLKEKEEEKEREERQREVERVRDAEDS